MLSICLVVCWTSRKELITEVERGGDYIDKPIEPTWSYIDIDPGAAIPMPPNHATCPTGFDLRTPDGKPIDSKYLVVSGLTKPDLKCFPTKPTKGSD